MINEKQIHYLLTAAQEHNITAAARKLYISQPALSRMILDLEHTLGTPLFIRDHGNLYLTQVGEIYIRGCKDVLAVSRSVEKQISDINDSQSGQIRLGVTSLTGEFLLPFLLNTFEQQFPHVELVLIEERMSTLQEMVKMGKADLAFVYQTNEQDLGYRMVLENPIYLQVPSFFMKGSNVWKPGTDNPALSPSSLSGQPMILLKKGRGMREAADRFLMQYQISPSRIIETENIHLAQSLVTLDKGFTFVPSIAIWQSRPNDSAGFFCEIEHYPMYRSLYCCYRKYGYLTEAERFLINLIPDIRQGDGSCV